MKLCHNKPCTNKYAHQFQYSEHLHVWSCDKRKKTTHIRENCACDESTKDQNQGYTYERKESDEERLDPTHSTPKGNKYPKAYKSSKYIRHNTGSKPRCTPKSYNTSNKSNADLEKRFPKRHHFFISISKKYKYKTQKCYTSECMQNPERHIFTNKIGFIR